MTLNNREITLEECIKYRDIGIELIRYNIKKYGSSFLTTNSTNNFYGIMDNKDWTNGFWTGELWLAYEATKEDIFKKAALDQVSSFEHRIQNIINVDHHDMGFLYTPSCVAAYKLIGDEKAKEAAILAADNLMSRFQEKGQFFQAWGQMGDNNNYRLIIDCLLNMPLLYWASEVTGNYIYSKKADAHINTSVKCIIREDNSTVHTYFFDPETGKPDRGVTCQGYRDGSAWARGQAWGIYGCALSYQYSKNPEFINIFKRLTDFFIHHLPEDNIPYWDFDFTTGSTEPRDSSALAITICGILHMAKYLKEEEKNYYTIIAKRLLYRLAKECAVTSINISNGLLLHGTYAKKSPYNTCRNGGVDECNLWGDYFYLEALTRMSKDWNPYW